MLDAMIVLSFLLFPFLYLKGFPPGQYFQNRKGLLKDQAASLNVSTRVCTYQAGSGWLGFRCKTNSFMHTRFPYLEACPSRVQPRDSQGIRSIKPSRPEPPAGAQGPRRVGLCLQGELACTRRGSRLFSKHEKFRWDRRSTHIYAKFQHCFPRNKNFINFHCYRFLKVWKQKAKIYHLLVQTSGDLRSSPFQLLLRDVLTAASWTRVPKRDVRGGRLASPKTSWRGFTWSTEGSCPCVPDQSALGAPLCSPAALPPPGRALQEPHETFFFLNVCFQERAGEGQREGGRIPSRVRTVSAEPDTGLEPTDYQIMT